MTKGLAQNGLTLLVDGKNAFPEILRCIENARKSLKINMFIWRDDEIGNRMAQAVLNAAERGVEVFVSADRYGVILEKSEECKKSFFHKRQSLAERLKIKALTTFYPMKGAPKRAKDERSPLYERLLSHPKITLETDVFKADHSKYYLIDGEILFVGGINIEDKENGRDMQGREYQDYMVKLVGKEYVAAFLAKAERGEDIAYGYFFGVNVKNGKTRRFEMEALYLNVIDRAREELHITMAYFSPLRKFVRAIVRAQKRGVKVVVTIPQRANYQSDTNLKTARKLMKATGDGITLYLSPKMVHTKLVANDEWLSVGSTNITKKAFAQLSELNLFVKNENGAFQNALHKSMRENYALCRKISTYKEIKYNKTKAFIEGFLV